MIEDSTEYSSTLLSLVFSYPHTLVVSMTTPEYDCCCLLSLNSLSHIPSTVSIQQVTTRAERFLQNKLWI